ncbi:hypothetical protein C0J52_23439 [Blattella germanica]|nr:hypothetical protein C0J52_23439 [Blattella germanica]
MMGTPTAVHLQVVNAYPHEVYTRSKPFNRETKSIFEGDLRFTIMEGRSKLAIPSLLGGYFGRRERQQNRSFGSLGNDSILVDY